MYEDQKLQNALNNGLGVLSNMGQKVPESGLMSLMREYVSVKEHFDVCCKDLARAKENKASAEKHLLELSAKVEAAVQDGKFDPTEPKATGCSVSGNFAIGQGRY